MDLEFIGKEWSRDMNLKVLHVYTYLKSQEGEITREDKNVKRTAS